MMRTLNEIEIFLGFTARAVASEYLAGDYGDAAEWNADSIASAEMDGDTGDQLDRDDALVFSQAVGEAFEERRTS